MEPKFKDITKDQVKRWKEKEKVKTLIRVVFGEDVQITERLNSSIFEVKEQGEIVLQLGIIGDSLKGYSKRYRPKFYEAFGEAYEHLVGRRHTMRVDYSGFKWFIPST